mgnify:FL=1
MKQIVIMPGGFHPFHAGHLALYNAARQAFPGAEVFVAATNDTSERPFPFAIKEKLARLAGVEPGHFVQVKSPFQAREITANFDPNDTQLIFVRSEKDRDKPPQPGGVKKDGSLAYLQPIGKNIEPMSQHGYMAYLPTVEFGPGMTSATEIRTAWPRLTPKRKTALVMSLYPATQKNPKLAATVVKMLDMAIGGLQEHFPQQLAQGGMIASYQEKDNQPVGENKKHAKREPELANVERFAQMHYPTYGADPEAAFAKWVQRSLRHSEEDDRKQNQAITDLARKMRELQAEFHRLQHSRDDYVAESKN